MSQLTELLLEELRAIRRLLEKQSQTTFTNADAAKAIGVANSTFGEMIRRGEVRRVKVGEKFRVPASEIERLSTPVEEPSPAPRGHRQRKQREPELTAEQMYERGMKRLKGRGR